MIIDNNFPREVGPPRKVVFNKDELLDYVNIYNGKKSAVYSTIYHFDTVDKRPDYDTCVISCLFFDFDDKDCNAYEECKKLHLFCLEKNIKHKLVMSGRGYHCYVIVEQSRAMNSRGTIYNAQHYFIDKLNLNLDTHVIGNPAQMARIPNTWNGKAKLFCIPLSKEIFDKGDKYIKELAKKQNYDWNFICDEEFDIKEFDYEPNGFSSDLDMEEIDIDIENFNIEFPPCILNIIKRGEMRWKERYLLILFLREKGYSKKNVYDILTNICQLKKLNHCVNEEKQLHYLFEREDLLFPTCNKIALDGYCSGKCKFYNKVVYK